MIGPNPVTSKPKSAASDDADADALAPEVEATLREHADVIRGCFEKLRTIHAEATKIAFEAGERLTKAKEHLGHGHWLGWLEREFKLSEQSARNFMNVYETFKSKTTVLDLPIDASALYLLAAPSVSQDARDEAIEKAKSGEKIDKKGAKAIRDKHKSEKSPSRASAKSKAKTSPSSGSGGVRMRPLPLKEFCGQLVALGKSLSAYAASPDADLMTHVKNCAVDLNVLAERGCTS
jgi:hypothetical protein